MSAKDPHAAPASTKQGSATEPLPPTPTWVVEHAPPASARDTILLKYGEALVLSSTAQAVDFHKTMLTLTATFATLIASAAGLVIWGDSDYKPGLFERLFLAVPVILMLLSSICFASGFFPRYKEIYLSSPTSIENALGSLMSSRRWWAVGGFLLFASSLLTFVGAIVWYNG
ncbi:MAG: hypothetical protein ABW277_09175 [Longimicrobiaceae bacterium]